MRTGVIGIGDMGSGLAKNLMANGFVVTGHDLKPDRLSAFGKAGGKVAANAAEVGANSDAVFIMVMNGDEAKSVIFDHDGLLSTMTKGGTILMSATIKPREAREIADMLGGSGIHMIDTPVSGGFPGAQSGTLTMMAAAPDELLDQLAPVMNAVSANIHRVGTRPGEGQTVNACLQSLIGAQFSALLKPQHWRQRRAFRGRFCLMSSLRRPLDAASSTTRWKRSSTGNLKVPAAISTRCTKT